MQWSSCLLLGRGGHCSDEVDVLLHFLSFFLCLDFLVEARLVWKRPFDEKLILAFGRGSQALYGCLDGGRKPHVAMIPDFLLSLLAYRAWSNIHG